MTMLADPRAIDDTLPLGTTITINIDDTSTHVQVCGIDLRHGYRVSNRMWGGRIDTWLPLTELHTSGK